MPAAAGHIASASARFGSIRCGRPPATAPTVATPRASRPSTPGRGDRQADGHEWRGRTRRHVLERHEQPQQRDGQEQRRYRRLRQLLRQRDQVAEEAGLREVDAQQLRELVDDDHEADARLEAGEHRVGDEGGDESQAEERRQPEQDPDQHRQRRRGGDERGRVAAWRRTSEFGGRQDGNRRRGADAERSRRSRARHRPPSARWRCTARRAAAAARSSRRPSPSARPPRPPSGRR